MTRRGETGVAAANTAAAFAAMTGFLALIQVFVLLSGALRIPLYPILAVLYGGAAAFGASCLAAWIHRTVEPAGSAPAPTLGRTATGIGWFFALSAGAWAAWIWLRLGRLAWLRPSYDWDGLYYHLPALNAWAVAGRVHWIDGIPDVPFVNYPMGVETFTFWALQLSGQGQLVDGANLAYWPLAVASVALVAALLGARGPWAWWAGALAVGAPVLLTQSVTNYIDPGFSAATMAAVAASMLLLESPARAVLPRAVLWGLALGLMAGTKGTGLAFALILGFLVPIGRLILAPGESRRLGLALPAAVLCAVAVGGYWSIRAWLMSGNPIFPIELKLGELVIRPGYDMNRMLADNLPAWLAAKPAVLQPFFSWLQTDGPYASYAPTGGLGYHWIALGLPAAVALFIAAVVRRGTGRWRTFLLLAVLVGILFLLQPAPWWGRFTVWLHILGLPSLALVVVLGLQAGRWPVRGLVLVVAVAACGLVAWESARTIDLAAREGQEPDAVAASGYIGSSRMVLPALDEDPAWPEFLAARHIGRSGWSRIGTLLGGILSDPVFGRRVTVLPDRLAADQLPELQRQGIEWICWDVLAVGEADSTVQAAAVRQIRYQEPGYADFHFLKLPRSRTGVKSHG